MKTFTSASTQTESETSDFELTRKAYDALTSALLVSCSSSNHDSLNLSSHPLLSKSRQDFHPLTFESLSRHSSVPGSDFIDIGVNDLLNKEDSFSWNNCSFHTSPSSPIQLDYYNNSYNYKFDTLVDHLPAVGQSTFPSPDLTPQIPPIQLPDQNPHLNSDPLHKNEADPIGIFAIPPAHVFESSSSVSNHKSAVQKTKSKRFKASADIFGCLSAYFRFNPFPTAKEAESIGIELDMKPRQVKVWFQNRRSALKKMGEEIKKKEKLNGRRINKINFRNTKFEPHPPSPFVETPAAYLKLPLERKTPSKMSPTVCNTQIVADDCYFVPSHYSNSSMYSLLSRQSPIATPPRMKLSIPSLQHCIAPNPTPTDIILMNSLLLPLDQSQFHFSESDLLHAHLGNMDLMTPSPMILPRNENNATCFSFDFVDHTVSNNEVAAQQFPILDSEHFSSSSPIPSSSQPPNQQLTKPVSLDGVMDSPPQSPNPPPTISPKKNKKMRFRATEAELDFLLTVFESNPFPSTRQRIQLAEKLSLDPKQILFWFQNRRATLKSNGIVAVKPKKTSAATSLAFRGKNCTLSPLSAENPFFYVAETSE